MQLFICLVVCAVAIVAGISLYAWRQFHYKDILYEETLTHERVVAIVNQRLLDLLNEDASHGKDEIEEELIYRRRCRIEEAYTNCVLSIAKDKLIVKELIIDILKTLFPTQEDLYKVYPLDSENIEPAWQWEVLMTRLYEEHKKDSVKYLIDKYNWKRDRYDIEDGTVASRFVDEDDLYEAFHNEMHGKPLTFREALLTVATIIYIETKGMGVIDTLRDMNVDGVNIGTSGSIMHLDTSSEEAQQWPASRSVWVFYEGVQIHLAFLNMGTEDECRRIVLLASRYNNPGQLTEKKGFIVNTMYDKSRVLALRPPAAEYWAVFIRKFNIKKPDLEKLLNPFAVDENTGQILYDDEGNPVHKYKNAQLPIKLIELEHLGQVTSAYTGRQGSGKTTLMIASLSKADGRHTIRVLEMAPEMYLRESYPRRNILSVAETVWVSAEKLQDALKKSDAAISIVGEVATNVVAARMLQMAQVASIYTIFSHHANTTADLAYAITNSIVADAGGSVSPETILPQVLDAIKVDNHLDYDVSGNRYVERVTELIRLDAKPYPEYDPKDPVNSMNIITREYYTRVTDRQMFTTRDIIRFNTDTFTYEPAEWFSQELTRKIFSHIPKEDRQQWKDWIYENWGDVA